VPAVIWACYRAGTIRGDQTFVTRTVGDRYGFTNTAGPVKPGEQDFRDRV